MRAMGIGTKTDDFGYAFGRGMRILFDEIFLLTAYAPAAASFGVWMLFIGEFTLAAIGVSTAVVLWMWCRQTLRYNARHSSPMGIDPIHAKIKDNGVVGLILMLIFPFVAAAMSTTAVVLMAVVVFVLGRRMHYNAVIMLSGWKVYRIEEPDGSQWTLLTRDPVERALEPRRIGKLAKRVLLDKGPKTHYLEKEEA